MTFAFTLFRLWVNQANFRDEATIPNEAEKEANPMPFGGAQAWLQLLLSLELAVVLLIFIQRTTGHTKLALSSFVVCILANVFLLEVPLQRKNNGDGLHLAGFKPNAKGVSLVAGGLSIAIVAFQEQVQAYIDTYVLPALLAIIALSFLGFMLWARRRENSTPLIVTGAALSTAAFFLAWRAIDHLAGLVEEGAYALLLTAWTVALVGG